MENTEIHLELESLVEAIEQTFTILIGTIAETTAPATLLTHLRLAEDTANNEFGPNEWRDRVVRKMQLVVALKARQDARTDASQQKLISILLTPQTDPGSKH